LLPLASWRAGGFDAVILDIGLPDRNGEDLLRDIRALHPSLPVVLATGQKLSELGNAFRSDRKVAFATKPYTERDLLQALRAVGIHAR
jgi:CheY-like chemotaxis protein